MPYQLTESSCLGQTVLKILSEGIGGLLYKHNRYMGLSG